METTLLTRPRHRSVTIIRLFRLLNTLPKWLLRSPLHSLMSKHLLLLTFTGRKSGQPYTVPISYVQQEQTLLAATDHSWWKNLCGQVPVRLWLRGEERTGSASAIIDPPTLAELYRQILAANPTHGRFLAVKTGADGQPDGDDLQQAIARGMAIIQIQLG